MMQSVASGQPALTVVVVSFNTKGLTLKALETLYSATRRTCFDVVVIDNASADGSADAIAQAFPQARLIRSEDNLGFAAANNLVIDRIETPWVLLLNPDTEVHDGAVDRLMDFAQAHPENGIYGGRTVFPDGSLNIASCWNQITPWSVFCHAVGLTAIFKRTALFDTEAIGRWRRDSVREVDIVVGCFMLVRTDLWRRLGGFDRSYFMYGEEADLCLRAKALGAQPIITPDAQIMHLVGAASAGRADKTIYVAQARAALIRAHWTPLWRPWGWAMLWLWAATRRAGSAVVAAALRGQAHAERRRKWEEVWRARRRWLHGTPTSP